MNLTFEYRNKYDMGSVLYQEGYRQYLFLDAELSTPKYNVEEEGEQDGDNNFLPTFSKTEKIYNIKFPAHAALLDAVYFLQMHVTQFGEVNLTIKNGETSRVKTMSIATVDYPKNSELSIVTMEVSVDYKLLNSANQYNVDCLTPIRTDIAGRITSEIVANNPIANGITSGLPYIFEVTGYTNDVYIYNNSESKSLGWYALKLNKTGITIETTGGVKYFFDGAKFREYPTISSYALSGLTYSIKGVIPFETFVKLEYRTGTSTWTVWTEILTASQFKNVGFQFIKPVAKPYTLRVLCYDHNCSYGYSDEIAI